MEITFKFHMKQIFIRFLSLKFHDGEPWNEKFFTIGIFVHQLLKVN